MTLEFVHMSNDPVPETDVLLHTVRIETFFDSRSAAALAERAARIAGLGRVNSRVVAIATCELATNIVRHAEKGTIRIWIAGCSVKIVAEDRGPGIPDVAAAQMDGHSRGARVGVDSGRSDGIGCGLGAVLRLMDEVEIESSPSVGTRVTAIKKAREGA